VFVGPYVKPSERPKFAENYFKINEGLLSFPVAFPGTPLWRAIKVFNQERREGKKGEGQFFIYLFIK
jgi:hypothetical protein